MAVELDKGKGLLRLLREEYDITSELTADGHVRVFVGNDLVSALVDDLVEANTMYRWTIAMEDTSCQTIIMRRRDDWTVRINNALGATPCEGCGYALDEHYAPGARCPGGDHGDGFC